MVDGFSYAKAGVDVDATDAAKRRMAESIDRSDPRVLNRLGAFGSLVEGRFEGYDHPVLVLKTEEHGRIPSGRRLTRAGSDRRIGTSPCRIS